MTFVPGDVVALKSGGQSMTILKLDDESAECIWIGEEGELFRELIPTIALVAAFAEDDENEADEEPGDEDDKHEETAAAAEAQANAA